MPLRITTWNANSIRLREIALRRIVAEIRPDVLCLQEIKCEDAKFPFELCRDLGFPYLHVSGQKAYHGVAILSRVPLLEPFSRRQVLAAAMISLNTISLAVSCDRAPLVRTVR